MFEKVEENKVSIAYIQSDAQTLGIGYFPAANDRRLHLLSGFAESDDASFSAAAAHPT